jgi:DNA-directed RNA polymerase alpha subunit
MRLTFEASNISEIRELHQMLTRLLAPEAIAPPSPITGDSIFELPLSTRTMNALEAYNILTISKLMSLKRHELLAMSNLGKISADEIKAALRVYVKC